MCYDYKNFAADIIGIVFSLGMGLLLLTSISEPITGIQRSLMLTSRNFVSQ